MSKLLVIIPLYNKENTIVRTVNSVLAQDYLSFNLLIINDGSNDHSLSKVEAIKDGRISILNQENKGVSAARNTGIQHAQQHNYDIIAFIDGDDYWFTEHLSTIMNLFNKNSNAQVAATNYNIKLSSNTIITTKFSNLEFPYSQTLPFFFSNNYFNSILTSSSFAFKTEILEKTGVYNIDYSHGEDTDFFIRLGIYSNIAFSSQVTVLVDKGAQNRSQLTAMINRNVFNLSLYDDYKIQGLKKYLDLNRFSIAISHKMDDNLKEALYYQKKIDLNNLTRKQQQLLKMSRLQLKILYKIKKSLAYLGLDLRTG